MCDGSVHSMVTGEADRKGTESANFCPTTDLQTGVQLKACTEINWTETYEEHLNKWVQLHYANFATKSATKSLCHHQSPQTVMVCIRDFHQNFHADFVVNFPHALSRTEFY